ncbi:MAG: alkaline phosphatase D family protein [Proteobacteria bacterium]|nr:alkaline phosphatase D family protein [Pseudomonadota bacterium]
MPQFTRRTLLKLTAAALPSIMLAGCGGSFDPESIPESIERFPRTPMAGDVTQSRAILTFHVADDTDVTLRIWTEDEVVVDQLFESNGDGFHKAMIDDLTEGSTYKYAVFGGSGPRFEDRGLIGQFKTAPADDALEPVRIALLSCIGQGTFLPDFYMPEGTDTPTTEPFQWEVLTHADGMDIDAFIHLGDMAYLDFVWSQQEGALDAYLHAWGYYHGGGYRPLFPLAALYATWDDHESTDNRHFDPWDMTEEDQAKLANAKTAWYKVVPIDAMTPEDGPVWRDFSWGQTLDLIILDCRYELQEDHLMSEDQLSWLLDKIEASTARFICVATPKPFANITSSTNLFEDNADRWDGYPDDRVRMTALLDKLEANNVIFVTGDIHMNYLGRASESGDLVSDKVWEVCTTSGNTSPMANSLSDIQFDFVGGDPHFPVLTFDPDAGTVHVAFHAVDGSVAYEKTLDDL